MLNRKPLKVGKLLCRASNIRAQLGSKSQNLLAGKVGDRTCLGPDPATYSSSPGCCPSSRVDENRRIQSEAEASEKRVAAAAAAAAASAASGAGCQSERDSACCTNGCAPEGRKNSEKRTRLGRQLLYNRIAIQGSRRKAHLIVRISGRVGSGETTGDVEESGRGLAGRVPLGHGVRHVDVVARGPDRRRV